MKSEPNLWTNYGTMEREKITEVDNKMYEYEVQGRVELTHDSRALLLTSKEKVQMITPIGYHVNVTANINGKLNQKKFGGFIGAFDDLKNL